MKNTKKILSLLMSLVMLLSITTSIDLSAYAYTSGDFEYSVSGSNATITKYTGSATSVTIPSKIDGYTVTSIGDDAFYNCTSLTSVTIPSSVKRIGDDAFSECTSLTSVTIPNSVKSIGSDAFDECNKLNKVNISSIESWCKISFSNYSSNPLCYAKNLYLNDELVTDLVIPNSVTSIGKYAFSGFTSLTSVTIPNSVTTIGYNAFYRVNNIVYNGSASGSPWGAKSVNGYVDGYLVYKDSAKKKLLGCSAQATSVTIPNSVTSIGSSAFESCTSLTSVTIPNSVTSIGNDAFYYCTSLSSVTIPNSVTSIGDRAFFYCTSLTSITIPNSIKSIGEYAFCLVNNIEYHGSASGSPWGAKSVNGYVDGYLVYRDSTKKELLGCSSQPTSVTIPNSVTIIGGSAFEYCTSLTSVTIPNSVTNIGGYAFEYCTSLTSVTIPNSVTNIGGYAFRNCTSLTSVTIPNSVTSIGSYAFYNCTSLTSVTISDSVTSIGEWAFYNCTSLTSVTIGNSVTSIGKYAFDECTKLNKVNISSIESWCKISFSDYTSNPLNYAKNLYLNDELVTDLVIPNSVTSISDYAFYNCTSLTSVTIPNSVTSIGNDAFDECTKLNKVNISSIESWCKISFSDDTSNPLYYANNLYLNDELVTDLVIPNSVTSIGNYAFYNCTSLTSVTIPNSVISIGGWAFTGCSSLSKVNISSIESWCKISFAGYYSNPLLYSGNLYLNDEFVTDLIIPNSVTSIGEYAFEDCTSLTSLTIPNSVINIGDYAFYYCTKIKYVFYSGTQSEWLSIDIGKNNTYLTSAKIHYNSTGDHSWNNGAVTKQPTCVNTGTKKYTCTVCNETKEETINVTGVHTYSSRVTQEATCTENGVRTYTCSVCNDSYTDVIQALGHSYSNQVVPPTCIAQGYTKHTCSVCGDTYNDKYVNATAHSNRVTVSKATITKNGSVVSKCSKCGKSTTQVIYYPKTISLSATSYTYDGKVKTPSVTVKDSKGKVLRRNTDYTVSYASGRKNVGKYAVKIIFKGNYSGTKTVYFTIKPKGTNLSKVTAGKKGFKVYWKKQATQTTGYQIQYSTSSKFSKAKTVTLTKNSYTSKSISKLSAKKKYYVRIRTFKKVKYGGKYVTIYSSWSKAKSVITKK